METGRVKEVLEWLAASDTNDQLCWCVLDDIDLSADLPYLVRCSDPHWE